jgi:hypothetical protein
LNWTGFSATGGSLSYRWTSTAGAFANGTSVIGTNPVLNLTSVTSAHAGDYTVEAYNSFSSVTSTAALRVMTAVGNITISTGSLTVVSGSLVANPGQTQLSLEVNAAGTDLQYQWSRGAQPILGATSKRYTIDQVSLLDSGTRFSA